MARDRFPGRYPLHVTLRAADGVGSLRRERVVEVVRGVITKGGHRADFRVVEFNVLGNHIHLMVESKDASALARGMQGLTVRLARRVNATLGRAGKLFAERYHARVLRNPREVRNALRYVLLNARHHAADRGQVLAPTWVDPYSSAPWFDGWRDPLRRDVPWLSRLVGRPRPTATPRTWLLSIGWRHGGLFAFDEVPGRRRRCGGR